jgi:hypothetical protein
MIHVSCFTFAPNVHPPVRTSSIDRHEATWPACRCVGGVEKWVTVQRMGRWCGWGVHVMWVEDVRMMDVG